ncbi:multicystatin-like [Canna indica]|uniref:Cysteine proteinase inhibitor n=1 Tax=Canna indica TaxID=4628 RepID=A0AAQ3KHS5_9LILI|nr:multicystatin-like [Canna indica]
MADETKVGGIHDSEVSQNSAEIQELARFAVEEHNKKANDVLEFGRVVKVKEQVVAGTMYYVTVEAKNQRGETNLYEAKVWVKPWMNFKELQEFKQIDDEEYGSSSMADDDADVKVGGVHDVSEGSQNSAEIQELGRFAVEEHNKKANSALEFERVVKVKEQVVAGTVYYITLEAKDQSGETKLYEAKVWVQQWINFKELQEFKQIGVDDVSTPAA